MLLVLAASKEAHQTFAKEETPDETTLQVRDRWRTDVHMQKMLHMQDWVVVIAERVRSAWDRCYQMIVGCSAPPDRLRWLVVSLFMDRLIWIAQQVPRGRSSINWAYCNGWNLYLVMLSASTETYDTLGAARTSRQPTFGILLLRISGWWYNVVPRPIQL